MAALALFLMMGWGEISDLPFQPQARLALGQREGCIVMMEAGSGKLLAAWPPEKAGRAVAAPGSVFKLITAFAALEEGVTAWTHRVECQNVFPLENQILWCSKAGGHGSLNLKEAIAYSCNVYFYSLGLQLGARRLMRWAVTFGLGQKTGSSLPGEEPGHLPEGIFHPIRVARVAIGQGQGFRVTPLQMVVLASTIANEGKCYRPLVSGKPVLRRHIRARSPHIWKGLQEGMCLAVERGTGRQTALKGMRVAGKTGSPERVGASDMRDGWFIGFAPTDHPEVAIAVYVARGHGGEAAAPIARKMLESWRNR